MNAAHGSTNLIHSYSAVPMTPRNQIDSGVRHVLCDELWYFEGIISGKVRMDNVFNQTIVAKKCQHGTKKR